MIKMCTKKAFIFFAAVVFSLSHLSCNKEKTENGIEITILSPTANGLFYGPGFLTARVRVVSTSKLRYVKFNITDENFVTVFGDVSFLPDSNVFEKETGFEIEAKTVEESGKYYFHVFAQNANEDKNKYTEIVIKNRKEIFNGIVLFAGNGQGKTDVIFHNGNKDTVLMNMEGENLSSGFSIEQGLLFVQQTGNPVLSAFFTGDFSQSWNYSVQTVDKPLSMVCDHAQNIVYCASTDGSIRGFDMVSGVEKISTPFMRDTLPVKLGITRDFIFAECRTKLNGQTFWMVYYKNTGTRLSIQQVQGSVAEVFNNYSDNTVDLVKNRGDKTLLVEYDLSKNLIVSEKAILTEPSTAAAKLQENDYVFATGRAVYHYSGGFVKVLDCIAAGDIVSLTFDNSENMLFVLKNNSFTVLTLPGCNIEENVEYEKPLTGMQPLYKYQNLPLP